MHARVAQSNPIGTNAMQRMSTILRLLLVPVLAILFVALYAYSTLFLDSVIPVGGHSSMTVRIVIAEFRGFVQAVLGTALFSIPLAILYKRYAPIVALICITPVLAITFWGLSVEMPVSATVILFQMACLILFVLHATQSAAHFAMHKSVSNVVVALRGHKLLILYILAAIALEVFSRFAYWNDFGLPFWLFLTANLLLVFSLGFSLARRRNNPFKVSFLSIPIFLIWVLGGPIQIALTESSKWASNSLSEKGAFIEGYSTGALEFLPIAYLITVAGAYLGRHFLNLRPKKMSVTVAARNVGDEDVIIES